MIEKKIYSKPIEHGNNLSKYFFKELKLIENNKKNLIWLIICNNSFLSNLFLYMMLLLSKKN